ncbi:MAG: SUMF1/EgtB/PvdO family nonheme iron enzyme [Phycisphaerales bacterium]|nr:SUMF1/EgtB/PvdO family nonheme iron enzyme [Phycisphaerales bacterium]
MASAVRLAGVAACLAGIASPASGQVSSIVWHGVGDPGNAPWQDDDYPNLKFNGRGAVDHRYRMSETELTVSQWVEFVQAYGPYADDPSDPRLTSDYVMGSYDGDEPVYWAKPGYENLPASMSWRYAARFCNWMHNGQVNEAWAFESGAYDTSTFTSNDGPPFLNDQDTRSPGARYWIPSMDEWMKAAYYDPNRFGEGEGGWWEQPARRNEWLISGRPEDGGETNAGTKEVWGFGSHTDAGQYPDIRSPWGLLDMSGGLREYTEEWTGDDHHNRHTKGSSFYDSSWQHGNMDWVGSELWRAYPDGYGTDGLRVAASVPGPSGLVLGIAVGILAMPSRGRR